jgi:hypothetical protein
VARPILDEVLKVRPDHIEHHQLAHAVGYPNGRACNRTAFLPERRRLNLVGANNQNLTKSTATLLRAATALPLLVAGRNL